MDAMGNGAEPLLLAPPSAEAIAARKQAAVRRRRRRTVTRESVRRAGSRRSPRTAQKLAELWDQGAQDSRRLAERYRTIVETTHDPLGEEELGAEATAMEELHLSMALRCTRSQAARSLREAHRAHSLLPHCVTRLGRGEFPVAWFEKLIERTTDLEDDAVLEVDVTLAQIDLDISPEAFTRQLRHLVTSATARSALPPHARPQSRRRVVLDPPRPDGTGCLRVIGPIPEILDLSRRLDRTAHAVKNAQLSALENGTPIPADPEGLIESTGEVPSLAATRYAVLMSGSSDIDGVAVPAARFRLNVTVPVLTLLGESDAPGMLEGTIPIPAPMARDLAGRESTWYRVLTDPLTGRFLPLPAERYRPSPAQLEHLRLRHPTCAVPGCGRPTSLLSEADHIVEFCHEDPASGGATAVENLHDLCREHHRLKTLGLLIPVRDDEAGTTWWEASEVLMTCQEDARDLATPQMVAEMTAVWEQCEAVRQRREQTVQRLRALRDQGLSPGDEVTGPDGEEGWRISETGEILPPGDPPPY